MQWTVPVSLPAALSPRERKMVAGSVKSSDDCAAHLCRFSCRLRLVNGSVTEQAGSKNRPCKQRALERPERT